MRIYFCVAVALAILGAFKEVVGGKKNTRSLNETERHVIYTPTGIEKHTSARQGKVEYKVPIKHDIHQDSILYVAAHCAPTLCDEAIFLCMIINKRTGVSAPIPDHWFHYLEQDHDKYVLDMRRLK